MLDYFKLHFDFLMSHIMIACLVTLQLISILGMVYSSGMFEGLLYMDGYRTELSNAYFNESLMIIELIIILITIFSATLIQTKTNQFLMVYATHSKKSKLYFLASKIIFGMFLVILLLIINYLTYLLILNHFSPYDIDHALILKMFAYLLFEAVQMYSFTLMILSIINHMFGSIIPLVLFWYLETMSGIEQQLNKTLKIIFININPYNQKSLQLMIPLMMILLLIILYIFISYKKDCC